ncbi:MAG: hypothetical protein HRT73_14725, partial [Flavobacteriales bacterium]|nr:hypothetical protein [Flavobacteriales bacterium]
TDIVIGGNIGKNTATANEDALADYLFNFNTLHDYVDYFVVNVSCPNVKDLTKLQDTPFLLNLLGQLKEINKIKSKPKPILLKIAPDLNNSQLDEVIEIVAQTKIDGIIATNTTTSRENLKTDSNTITEIANGGLSGKPVTKRSTEVIKYLSQKSGGYAYPPTHETIDNMEHYARQDGKTVFKFAVTNMADVSAEIMEKNDLTSDDIAWLVPHQANKRIIDATARRMGVEDEKVMLNIEKYGNTTSGTIPLCLWEWENKLKKGDNIIIAAFGGGFTWGSIYLKWAYNS